MGLFVAAAPELVKEKQKNKKACGGGGKDVEKRTEVVVMVVVVEVEKCRREAMNAKERESKKELMFSECLCAAD